MAKWKDPLTKAERQEFNELERVSQSEPRICFNMRIFNQENHANRYGELVRKLGYTYNGGYFHGMACGREPARDYMEGGWKQFVVTC